jgi:cyclic beta-1,2-glucan synthetase
MSEHPGTTSARFAQGDAPLRGELLSADRLAEEARALAAEQPWIADERLHTTPLIGLMQRAATALNADNRELAQSARAAGGSSPAGEWLLDNFYLIEEQILIVREDLPADYGVELPRLTHGDYRDFPRLYTALIHLIAHTDARLDEEYLQRFIDGYQQTSPLTIGEVWAVPIMLRIGLVENLRRLSHAAVTSTRAERAADSWAQRLVLTAQDARTEALPQLLGSIDAETRGMPPAFFVRLTRRLGEVESGGEAINAWVERRLSAEGIVLEDASVDAQQQQAADQVSIANSITSIRLLDALDWREFFERVSVAEAELGKDPAQTYSVMDFGSRDRYRHALELIARRCPLDEIGVAEKVVALAHEALVHDPSDQVRGHVGWWLISGGRYLLEPVIGYRPTARERLYRGPLRDKGWLYWGSLAILTTALVLGLAIYAAFEAASLWQIALLLLISLVPLSELALVVVNRLAAFVFPPRELPKLDPRRDVDASHRTLVILPALLSSVSSTRHIIEHLETTYLANRDPNVAFGLLGDVKACSEPTRVDDGMITEAAVRGISELNERYEAEHGVRPFHLLIRERRYNESEGVWMGWERKRGALTELVREMRGDTATSFVTKLGEASFRRSCIFVITLDADTVLPRDGARKLISAIAHPLNRAQWRPGQPRVSAGYGLMQPRVGMTLPGSRRSRFAAMYSGPTGIDPYSGAVSDTYQDVFCEGSFTGKGIFEVDVFGGVLEERFPENTLLSHDLIEGSFLRTALASDIEVLDDYPANYLAAASRLHRWVRGDWQTLPWLALSVADDAGNRTPNPLSALHRWKMFDNMRRSFVSPAMLLMFVVGWLLLPDAAGSWPLFMLLLVLFPAYFSLADAMVFRPKSVSFVSTAPSILRDFTNDTWRGALTLAVLPHQAWVMVDAMVRAVYRMTVSHKHLLEWETAADAEKRAGTTRTAFWRAMGPMAASAVVVIAISTLGKAPRVASALPLVAIWLVGPFFAWWVSAPTPERVAEPLSDDERHTLRRISRKTWRFFDTFVVGHGHNLAPDNFQEDPGGVVAWRTSPTNIGLQLLSYVNGYDLGYVTVSGLEDRVSATLNAVAGLERFRGHYYNWYSIDTLEPLRPMYVSTVDSGNFAGHLLVLRIALLEASEAPLLGEQLLAGARDATMLALEDLVSCQDSLTPQTMVREMREMLDSLVRAIDTAETPRDLGEWSALLRRLDATATEAQRLLGGLDEATAPTRVAAPIGHETGAGLTVPVTPLEQLSASVSDVGCAVGEPLDLLGRLAPWATILGDAPVALRDNPALEPLFAHVPSLVGLAEGLVEARDAIDAIAADGTSETATREGAEESAAAWASGVARGLRESQPYAVELLARLRLTADIAREMWEHTDFSALYDKHRHLFSIGYNLNEGRLDGSYYDLLASECRLASFLAIAKGDVPQEHWFRLGRNLTKVREGRALVSWSASMFEYLMPLLVMRDWPATLLSETYQTVVQAQIDYGHARGVPWGVSESAFNAKDAALTYQYQAFGVPGLGLKRGLSDDVVVAPYATLLALPIAPRAVLANLAAFAAEGAEGRFGYYEALDYTAGRVPAGKTRAVVKAYFAHHQGMAFLAVGNALVGGRMCARFHADPMVGSAELLLQERLPRHVQLVSPHVEEVENVRSVRELPPPVTRGYATAETNVPATHFLSNGRYSVMITNGGGGYSRWNGVAVTRYREDLTRDCWGQFVYLRDVESGEVFSAPHNPYPATPDSYNVVFAPDKAEFRRRDGELETHVEVSVSPEDDVEIRRLTITNHSRSARTLEATSYFEIALAAQASDQAHKSFSNLFVQTESLPETHALLFTRRPRSADEELFWGLHAVACEADECAVSFETERTAFLGRLRGADNPAALDFDGPLGETVGPVLDPCCALRRKITIPPGESVRLVYTTGVADTRDAAVRLTEKYSDPRSAQRAIDLAWTASQLELRDLGISPQEAITLERLASRLVLTDPYSPLKVKTPVENGLQMSGLWSIGISGDLPILLVRVEELEHAPLVRQALLAHQYWRHKGLTADLVVLNTRPSGYADELDDRLRLLVRTGHALQLLDKPGGVYLRRTDQMHPDVLNLLLSVARATLDGDGGTIELQLNRRGKRPAAPGRLVTTGKRGDGGYFAPQFERPALQFDNGYGGFDSQTGEYVIVLEDKLTTPSPWIDVLASPEFGCTVSEAGVGCTWALNSHENRITTWNNDPVSDGSGEAIYVRDEETGEFWSPTPLPVRTPEAYVIRHGHGQVTFEHETHGIAHHLQWFIPPSDPIRICRLQLTNNGSEARKLSVTQFVEWVLGDSRSRAQQLVVTWFDAETDMLTAHNHLNLDFPGRCAFVACDRPLSSWTASRTEFVGRNGRPSHPAAMRAKELGGVSGRYHDNCGAMQTRIDLEPGESATVTFLLGQNATLEEARKSVARHREKGAVDAALASCKDFWSELLGTVQVDTPDDQLDLMVNDWLLYQATSCRLWGRTATYQSSGAYGFRDQLQDSLALLIARPELVREQIVEASRHQFAEGDVLHWWQPYSGRGVRTHISDDRHWLPLVVAEYLSATGDESVLDERTAFLEAPLLPLGEEDAYLQPAVSEIAVSVYEHCKRALEAGRPVGVHGLPLMGGGDWNDGMNRVGREGKGESIWLAWFLIYVLGKFAPIVESRGETELAEDYHAWSERLRLAVEAHGWDGAWYRRAYFDDGTPLGTHTAAEARIDAIAQAWATISGAADPVRAATALESVEEKLVRREDRLIALLTPPFDKMPQDPGYIKGYVPGVRENGGQYTHGALWVVLANLLRGDGGDAYALLSLLNPITHSMTSEAARHYSVEPYVVAADVYAAPPHTGRGGWTWYTGSASWFYRVALNYMLGMRIVAENGSQSLVIDPCIPKHWPGFTLTYRHASATYNVQVANPRGVNRGIARVELDGTVLEGTQVPLVDDGKTHEVVVTLIGG